MLYIKVYNILTTAVYSLQDFVFERTCYVSGWSGLNFAGSYVGCTSSRFRMPVKTNN